MLKTFFLGSLLLGCSLAALGQSFDFQNRPAFDFQFTDAQVNLQVDPSSRAIAGSVQYTLKANISGADTLKLDAAGLQVDSVLAQGKSVNFSAENDQLFITLTDSASRGDAYRVKIFYRGTPTFGLLKSSEGTIWTSMLPLSNEHWLPVKDHPRVQTVTTLSLQVPAGFTAFASGVETDENMMPDSTKKFTFRTGRPIPITALAFGLGKLHEEGASIGIKRVNSYAEFGSISPGEQSNIVNQSRQILNKIEQATGKDYPYQRLNLVFLNDHYWEQKPYGATTIFLYKNRGDWINQLRRGLYAQWIGVYEHEERWAQAWPINLLQTALHKKVSDKPALLEAKKDEPEAGFSTVYANFSADRWNDWQKYAGQNMEGVGNQLLPEIIEQDGGTITPASFNDAWYKLSGQPAMNVPQFENYSAANVQASDSVQYRVDFMENTVGGSLQLAFKSQKGVITQPLTLPVQITAGNGSNKSEVTFSGSTDTVSVSIPSGTRNVELMVPEGRPLALEQHKPVPYLLYQLRNAKTTEAKRKAALQIGYIKNNPDLQLALNDVMKQDMEPEVKAALLKSYGEITNGAEGTQQRFLDALDSDSPEVRAVALQVLSNYDSKDITNRLKTFAQNTSDAELSGEALKLYMQRIDSSDAISFTNTLVQQDTAGTRAIAAIGILGENGNTKKAVQLAGYYMEPVYAYSVRKQALQILLANDTSTEAWKKRIADLVNDPDPRIRFLTIKNIGKIPGANADSVLSSYTEYDARVKRVMSNK